MAAVLEDGEEMPDLAHLLDVLGRMVKAEEANLDEEDHEKQDHDADAAYARVVLRRDAMPAAIGRGRAASSGKGLITGRMISCH